MVHSSSSLPLTDNLIALFTLFELTRILYSVQTTSHDMRLLRQEKSFPSSIGLSHSRIVKSKLIRFKTRLYLIALKLSKMLHIFSLR